MTQSFLEQLLPEEKECEENSIRRRVYDAINVMAALGVIEKRGKFVSLDERMSRGLLRREREERGRVERRVLQGVREENRRMEEEIRVFQSWREAVVGYYEGGGQGEGWGEWVWGRAGEEEKEEEETAKNKNKSKNQAESDQDRCWTPSKSLPPQTHQTPRRVTRSSKP